MMILSARSAFCQLSVSVRPTASAYVKNSHRMRMQRQNDGIRHPAGIHWQGSAHYTCHPYNRGSPLQEAGSHSIDRAYLHYVPLLG